MASLSKSLRLLRLFLLASIGSCLLPSTSANIFFGMKFDIRPYAKTPAPYSAHPPVHPPTKPPVYPHPPVKPPIHPPAQPPVHPKPPVKPPVHPPAKPPVYPQPPVKPPVSPPTKPPVYPQPSVKPPVSPPANPPVYPQPPVKPPVSPPAKPPVHPQPPVKPPVSPPAKPPVYPQPPVQPPVHPPVQPPTTPPPNPPAYPPVKLPSLPPKSPPPRAYVLVQGVVSCFNPKSWLPIEGAKVKLVCKNTKYRLVKTTKTDKNGFYLIQAPNVSSYAVHKCRVYLVSSPKSTCKKLGSDGKKGGALFNPKYSKVGGKWYALYTAAPLSFLPK